MKKNTIKMTAAFLMLIATLGSCVKGDKGDPGTSGTNGTNGTNGNANVISSGTYSATSANWGFNSSINQYYANLIDSAVTSSVVSSGAVMVYTVNSDGSSTALPYNNGNGYYNNFVLTDYEVQIQIGLVTGAAPTNPGSKEYRIVVIPSSLRKANPNVNWNDYNQLKATFGSSIVETKLQAH